MHISDGILSVPIVAVGWIITILAIIIVFSFTLKKQDLAEVVPKFSIMTAAFFVISLIHIPLGPTSAHPMINAILGIVLGPIAYISIFIGLTLQTLLFQHGGVTTLGVNTALVGLPSILAYYIFTKGYNTGMSIRSLAIICGGIGIGITALLTVLVLALMGPDFYGLAQVTAVAHLPLIVIEAIITGAVIVYISKVKPELLPIKLRDRD